MSLMSQSDLVTPMAIRVAATLRLADLIAGGVCAVGELAEQSGADTDALHRLLRYLACRGLFTEISSGRYALNDSAAMLRSDHPLAMRDWFDLDGAGGRMDRAFTALLDVVRTGQPGYPVVHGRSLWEDADDSYNTLMGKHTTFVVPTVVHGYPWDRVDSVVDVGGGSGSLLCGLAAAYPGLTGTLIDLPAAADAARGAFAAAGLSSRCTAIDGDFFQPLPSGAQVYLLTWVLHDWPDADAGNILRRCADAAGEHGRVIVVENLDSGERPEVTTAMDLRLLVLFGGRERTPQQLDDLAAAAALHRVGIRTLPGATPVSLVEYRR
ncbi:methyltransferase [Rhodococcus maanshanensis]|uniref:methyltransferase n=1 Tax=Rhodococcus maanshanensis TaxID=183556 RepID=UPI0022B52893|nr:methyltransferase [Rhodococcus maanshanensis]MCZ4556790.1 methyltransferase [Rhodococcus maanshanensis]